MKKGWQIEKVLEKYITRLRLDHVSGLETTDDRCFPAQYCREPADCHFFAVTRSAMLSYSVFGMMLHVINSPGSI